MILLVNDANILIDLLKINLWDAFFELPYEFHVTDLVGAEIHESNMHEFEACIDSGTLVQKVFDFQELMEIQQLATSNKGLSIPDCSCLFHAKNISGKLLTGDAALRKCARKNQIEVHGILWVFDQLLEYGKVTEKTASEKLSSLLTINPRLPISECKKRLKKWSKL